MYGWKWYKRTFILALPVALLSLLTPSLNWLYAIAFFAASFPVVFELGKPRENLEHSTVTHFDRSSRWNRISYAKCAYLIFTAMIYGLLAHLGPLLVLVLWSTGLAGLWYVENKWEPKLLRNLLIEYISTKLLEMSAGEITSAVDAYLQMGIQPENDKIRHYLQTYLANNL